MQPIIKVLVRLQALPAHPKLPESNELRDPQGSHTLTPPEAECFLYHFETQLRKSRDLELDALGETSTRSSWQMANMRLERKRGSGVAKNL